MISDGFVERFSSKVHNTTIKRLWMRRLEQTNLTSKKAIVALGGPTVSLTTYGHRVTSVFYAIESIAAGDLKPGRLILWLDERGVFENPPASLRRLRDRGLEMRLTPNYGPYCKFYPYAISEEAHTRPLIICDDDVMYPRYWLRELAIGIEKDPTIMHCHRARVMRFHGDALASYNDWPMCNDTIADHRHFATGVGGVAIPPEVLTEIHALGTQFQAYCPKGDDIWLNIVALRSGFKVRQVRTRGIRLSLVPGSQAVALSHGNETENDPAIERTYAPLDLRRILTTDSSTV